MRLAERQRTLAVNWLRYLQAREKSSRALRCTRKNGLSPTWRLGRIYFSPHGNLFRILRSGDRLEHTHNIIATSIHFNFMKMRNTGTTGTLELLAFPFGCRMSLDTNRYLGNLIDFLTWNTACTGWYNLGLSHFSVQFTTFSLLKMTMMTKRFKLPNEKTWSLVCLHH